MTRGDAKSVQEFYDGLADDHHLIFQDWHAGVRWQGQVIHDLLRAHLGLDCCRVLDCCCGIGTQAIGLALLGHRVTASDLSPRCVKRARAEAGALGLDIEFSIADVRRLNTPAGDDYDAVIAFDNSLPHLLTDAELRRALRSISRRIRADGVFMASLRDYDAVLKEKPGSTPMTIIEGPPRRACFQIWDWQQRRDVYTVQQFVLVHEPGQWRMIHEATTYRALTRRHLSKLAAQSGLRKMKWIMPDESGYYQPILVARR